MIAGRTLSRRLAALSAASCLALGLVSGCRSALPPSKPIAQLTSRENSGHRLFQTRCADCHYANSTAALHGPGLQGLYKKRYLPSGAPANDDRVLASILHGRGMMPALGNTMNEQQLSDLIAYLHTL